MLGTVLLVAPVVLFAFLQNTNVGAQQVRYVSYNEWPVSRRSGRNFHDYKHGRSISDLTVKCDQLLCGKNAYCAHGTVRPVCACRRGYYGDPLKYCTRPECYDDTDCLSTQACLEQHCINPCESIKPCATNAICKVVEHRAACTCQPGYTGNAELSCVKYDPCDEQYSPCGPNTDCEFNSINGGIKCPCKAGYAPIKLYGTTQHLGYGTTQHLGCRRECESDGECRADQYCQDFKCKTLCKDANECGVNAVCEIFALHRSQCKCHNGYFGNPKIMCKPPECYTDSGCPKSKPICDQYSCVDPCANIRCGTNAKCRLVGREPACYCPPGMTGSPQTSCKTIELRELCEPNPCGSNSICTPRFDEYGIPKYDCKCEDGYYNYSDNGFSICKKAECDLDVQCANNRACVSYQCVDPCFGNDLECGHGAECQARDHIAVCTCRPGYKSPSADALVSCIDSRTAKYYRVRRHGNFTEGVETTSTTNDAETTEATSTTEINESTTEAETTETSTKAETVEVI